MNEHPTAHPTSRIETFGQSWPGSDDRANADQFLIARLHKTLDIQCASTLMLDQNRMFSGSQGSLLLVSDGQGDASAGSIASAVAVDALAEQLLDTVSWRDTTLPGEEEAQRGEIQGALERCQERLRHASALANSNETMAACITMALVQWPRVIVAHAGNGRCYLARGDRLQQVTTDHVQGPPKDSPVRWSKTLWNAVGGVSDQLVTEIHGARLEHGDQLLLCTDGVSDVLSDEAIRTTLLQGMNAEATCDALLHAARAEGGQEDATVALAQFGDDGAEPPLRAQAAHTAEHSSPPPGPRANADLAGGLTA